MSGRAHWLDDRPGQNDPPWANSLRAYATARKTPADPLCVSCCNRASFNRVANKNKKKSGGSKRNLSEKKERRELLFAEDSQQYARVSKRLGDGRFEVLCYGDGQERLAHVRGKMWKRVWIVVGDLVLVATRAYQDQRVDIVHKYMSDEERTLQEAQELPKTMHREDNAFYLDLERKTVDGACRAGFFPDDAVFGFGDLNE